MNITFLTANREIYYDELLELRVLMEHQQTNERYTNTSILIKGDYATIDVSIDEFGNVTLL